MADHGIFYDALIRRDPAFDDRFRYGVRTTGVFCRPTCKSRRPLERNVELFADATAARAAGYRACKRCRPDDLVRAGAPEWVAAACRALEEADEPLSLDTLAARVGVSRAHLQRGFTKATGVSPRRYAATLRKRRLRSALRDGASVADAAFGSGFGSGSRLYENAPATLGMTPAAFRRGGPGTAITYAIVDARLGKLLIAATDRGICFVALDARATVLERALRAEFPAASIERADDRLESAASAIVRYLSADAPLPDLPLDVRATAFQARVWEALRGIAAGTTTTYGALARALGDPNATRAVARACATNPVSLLIPCHRVTGSDGSLRGYRWGVTRKRALLELEARTVPA
jgi:AraC family transcriptional regulator, regulatory protein of adaptative response / methylated-DNA-[protein]-cysteine methyltransferase